MFLQLAHTRQDIFSASRQFVLECYKVTKLLPAEERFAMVQQILRACLSVHLQIAEGCSRKSMAERKLFFEISSGSVVEVDKAFDIAVHLKYVTRELNSPGEKLIKPF